VSISIERMTCLFVSTKNIGVGGGFAGLIANSDLCIADLEGCCITTIQTGMNLKMIQVSLTCHFFVLFSRKSGKKLCYLTALSGHTPINLAYTISITAARKALPSTVRSPYFCQEKISCFEAFLIL